jgi:N-acetylglucosamine-6-sulfatase
VSVRLRSGAAAFAVLATLAPLAVVTANESQGARQTTRPNIVLVVTDDQTLAAFNARTMPYTVGNVAGPGTTFNNTIATNPLCCPSRATMITGQYSHNTGVMNNKPGYPELGDKKNVLPSWLRAAGYYTAHVGRYLNEYPHGKKSKPAPGWDFWVAALEPRGYLSYALRVGRKTIEFGRNVKKDYLTTVINNRVNQVIRKRAPKSQPFFLQVDHMAPHAGPGMKGACAGSDVADALPADYAQFANEPLPTPPSFNEQDVSDKPSFIQKAPSLSERNVAKITQRYRCALGSLLAVDRGIAQIDAELAKAGELDNTVVLFISDNGFFYGEHRLPREKIRPYEEALRIPFAVRMPQGVMGPTASSVDELVGNVDLVPTILELAGAAPCLGPGRCRVTDGRSLVPLLLGQGGWPQDRGLAIEFRTGDDKFNTSSSCTYRGIRTAGFLYVQHTRVPSPPDGVCVPADERELYDLADDPFQLQNQYPAQPGSFYEPIQAALDARMNALATCAGIEGRDPPPSSGNYCE